MQDQAKVVSDWDQMHDQIKTWWSRLTDEDLNEIHGNYDGLVSILQLRYGYTLERAEEEVRQRLGEHPAMHPN
jgi:uncharacterized protein YjbJ (UPF0337 family)